MANPTVVLPEDCPEPFWHETHHYCPCCSWTNPDAPVSEVEKLRRIVLSDHHAEGPKDFPLCWLCSQHRHEGVVWPCESARTAGATE